LQQKRRKFQEFQHFSASGNASLACSIDYTGVPQVLLYGGADPERRTFDTRGRRSIALVSPD
jgi:hypothetical protein